LNNPRFLESSQARARLARLEWLSQLLDRRYLDPLLGLLLPGVGDVFGSLLGLYGIWVALSLKTHPAVIARMLLNLALDALIGALPIVGAVGDFFFRAHLRNLELLRARQETRVRSLDYLVLALAFTLFSLALVVPIALVGWLLSRLIAEWT
jgi:hypothetical protein